MCGRFHLATPAAEIARLFGVERIDADWRPRYNVAPSDEIAIVRQERASDAPPGAGAVRTLTTARWGLVPHWADAASTGYKMINARSEDAASAPAFRDAFQRRRCIVPADGFYEWQKLPRGRKQPMLIRRRDGRPFAMAGLWERWRPRGDRSGDWLETCTILTCAPNALVRPIHDRMPVILDDEELGAWLDPTRRDAESLLAMLRAAPEDALEALPVSSHVNSTKNDDPRCVQPMTAAPDGEGPTLFG